MWQDTLTQLLRSEISDLDSETYTDDRLQQILVTSAYIVRRKAIFMYNYVIDVTNSTISPDPDEANDYDFCVLTVYKAACTILTGEAKKAASDAIVIKDGPSFLDTRTASNNLSGVAKTACETYSELMNEYQFTGGAGSATVGQAILSPYSPGSFMALWNQRRERD